MATAFVWEQHDIWRAHRQRLMVASGTMWLSAAGIATLPRYRWLMVGLLLSSTGVTTWMLGRANYAAARTIAAVEFSTALEHGDDWAIELAWLNLMQYLPEVEPAEDLADDLYPTAVDLRRRRRERKVRLRAIRGQ
jgi:hypothetical protein